MLQQINCIPLPAPNRIPRVIAEWDHRYDTATQSIGDWLRTLSKPLFGTCVVISTTHHYSAEGLRSFDVKCEGFSVFFFKKTSSKKSAQYFPEDADFYADVMVDRKSGKVSDVTLWAKASRPTLAKWVERTALFHKLSSP